MKRVMLSAMAIVAIAIALLAAPSGGARPAYAGPAKVLMFNPSFCFALAPPPPLLSGCLNPQGLEYNTGNGDANLLAASKRLGDNDGTIDPGDFTAAANFTGGQIHQQSGDLAPCGNCEGGLVVLAFVDSSGPVTFHTTAGFFLESGGPTYTCTASGPVNPDPDCGGAVGSPPFVQDFVVVAYLNCTIATCATLGAQSLTVEQGGIVYPTTFTVVGEARSVSFLKLKTSIQAGVPNDPTGPFGAACPFRASLPFIQKALGQAETTVIVARALDINGTQIAGAWFNFTMSDTTKAVAALPQAPTLNLGTFGYGAPNIICAPSGATSGTSTLKAQLTRIVSDFQMDPSSDPGCATGCNPATGLAFGTLSYNVQGPPAALALSASPASVPCDGSATSTVSAALTDASGHPALAGTATSFSVQVLGTADPIDTTTNDKGIATSVVAPLAGSASGVPVVVSVKIGGIGQPDLTRSILVQCSGAVAGAGAGAGPVGGAAAGDSGRTGSISGPDTGSGGLPESPGTLSLWPWFALIAAAMAIVAGPRVWKGIAGKLVDASGSD